MSALGERTLFGWLTHLDSLRQVAEEGLDPDMVPSPELRPVLDFAVEYLERSGYAAAPSATVLRHHFSGALDDAEVDLAVEPEDDVSWAMDDLRASWVHRVSMDLNKKFATAMSEALFSERVSVLNEYATEMVQLGMMVEPKSRRVDMRREADGLMRSYLAREASKGTLRGMAFGLDRVDEVTYGIHPGELVVVAAPPKTGKSFLACWVAFKEWERGRKVVLFTLENSVEMTMNRIACMASGTDAGVWERGEANDLEKERTEAALAAIRDSDTPIMVMQPDIGQRSVGQMVREAQVKGADALLIDQLTFVEVGDDRRARHEKVGAALHELKSLISTGRRQIPCLLVHQVNREGAKAADKVGHLEAYHMAEAAEVERTADFIFGLYANRDQRHLRQVTLQMLGARRTVIKNWALAWRPEAGIVSVRGEVDLDG